MPTEHEPQGEERSLVTQNTSGTDLANSESRRILERMHFSHEFPARVLRLNEVFKSVAPALESVSINLIPGSTPRIDARPSYVMGYVVGIKSNRWGTAQLDIEALDEFHDTWGVYIEQLQAFLADVTADKEARIHAEPRSGFGDNIKPFNMTIPEVTQEVLEAISKDYDIEDWEGKVRKVAGLYEIGSFEIQLKGQNDPMFKLVLMPGYLNLKENRPFFQVKEMHYRGSTNQVESVMDEVVNHLFIPASPKESPETQG